MTDKTCHTCQHVRGENCSLFPDPKRIMLPRAHAVRRVGGQCGPTAHYWKLRVSPFAPQASEASKSAAGSIFGHAQHGHRTPAPSRGLAPGLDRKRQAAGERDDD